MKPEAVDHIDEVFSLTCTLKGLLDVLQVASHAAEDLEKHTLYSVAYLAEQIVRKIETEAEALRLQVVA
ncbi:MAG: hypothetical protein ABIQ70_07000 [Dokdonella sp.]